MANARPRHSSDLPASAHTRVARPVPRPSFAAIAAGVSVLAAVIAGCGGGSDGGQSTAAGATSKATVYEGPVTGFGSVVVNGVRFGDSGASVVDEDGAPVSRADVSLGTMVRVEGSASDDAGTGDATRLTVLPTVRGRVEAVDVAGSALTVMGQRVLVSADTVFEGTTGLATLAVGDRIEVHGLKNADGAVEATLVQKKAALTVFMIAGAVSQLDGTARTFRIGALTINYRDADLRPRDATLADGQLVRVRSSTAPVAGVLAAGRVQVRRHAIEQPAAGGFVALRGIVESAAVAGVMRVSGIDVDVGSARIAGGVAPAVGQRVKIVGAFDGDVLKATVVISDESRRRDGRPDHELHGVVTNLTDATHFMVHGVPVDASAAVIVGAGAGGLQAGQYVEVEGAVERQASGSVLKATRIEVKAIGSGSDDDARGSGRREYYGAVHDYVSNASFKVNGVSVDASGATFEDLGALADGLFVEVEGALVNGVLVATRVEGKRARVTAQAR